MSPFAEKLTDFASDAGFLGDTCENWKSPSAGNLGAGRGSLVCESPGWTAWPAQEGWQDATWGEQAEAGTACASVYVPRPDEGGGDGEWTPGCRAEPGRQATCPWARKASPIGLQCWWTTFTENRLFCGARQLYPRSLCRLSERDLNSELGRGCLESVCVTHSDGACFWWEVGWIRGVVAAGSCDLQEWPVSALRTRAGEPRRG